MNYKEYVKGILESYYADYEKPVDFLNEVVKYGCVSGIISEVIYYDDTKNIYRQYANEIDNMVEDYYNETGLTYQPKGYYYNQAVWITFEIIANELLENLE